MPYHITSHHIISYHIISDHIILYPRRRASAHSSNPQCVHIMSHEIFPSKDAKPTWDDHPGYSWGRQSAGVYVGPTNQHQLFFIFFQMCMRTFLIDGLRHSLFSIPFWPQIAGRVLHEAHGRVCPRQGVRLQQRRVVWREDPRWCDWNWERCFQRLLFLGACHHPSFSDTHWELGLPFLQIFDECGYPRFGYRNWWRRLLSLRLFDEPNAPKLSDTNRDRCLCRLQLFEEREDPWLSDAN